MADAQVISQITLPSGSVYNIKDAQARELISELQKYTKYLGVTTTALADGSTTNPITVGSKSVTAKNGDIVNYGSKEFIFNGTAWQEFGDLSGLGALAHKDTVTVGVKYTKATGLTGTHSFSGASMTSTGKYTPEGGISSNGTGTKNYTPTGSVSTPTITVTPNTATKYVAASATGGGSVTTGTPATCTLPSLTATVSNENLTLGWSAGSFDGGSPTTVTLPTFSSQTIVSGIKSATSTQPSFTGDGVELKFTGTEKNVSVSGTTTGSITGTISLATTTADATVTVGYTPT